MSIYRILSSLALTGKSGNRYNLHLLKTGVANRDYNRIKQFSLYSIRLKNKERFMDYNPSEDDARQEVPTYHRPTYEPPQRRAKFSLWRIFSSVLLVLSILANLFLILVVLAMATMISPASMGDALIESTLVEGNRHEKIATIHIDGIIDGRTSDWVQKQLETAEKDPLIQGLIVCINSPGGSVSASDQIHYAIHRYKERTGNPVLAFMQSMAASGGYYSAVACDTLMAEPTAITGSIGVIMNHLVIKDMLEEKLGVKPVVIKSGRRKDWPSLFSETTDEQRQYLDERIIQPAYQRFVQLVSEGRREKLTETEVRELADGSIFTAPDALSNNLIDDIGYFEQAISKLSERIGLAKPTVVEYREKFSMWNLLGAQSNPSGNIRTDVLEKLLIPQVMYLWDGRP